MRTILKFFWLALIFANISSDLISGTITGGDVKIVKENPEKALADASAQNHNVILVITDKNQTGEEASLALAQETAALTTNTLVALINKDNSEHQALLQKYNLLRYPAPYLIILSPDGVVTGGVVPGKMEAARLATFVPTARYNEALKARSEKKPSFVLIHGNQDGNYTQWVNRLNESASKLTPQASVITVPVTDATEKSFIERLGVQPVANENVVVVLNSAGMVTGKFNTLPEVGVLTQTATKQISKGCGSACPSSKSCGGKTSCGEKK